MEELLVTALVSERFKWATLLQANKSEQVSRFTVIILLVLLIARKCTALS
jgi:hypothetical protein